MITKSFEAKTKVCQVTFTCHAPSYAHHVSLCGDFNAWHPGANAMTRNEDGTFTASVALEVGSKIAFKYIDDHHQWFNDDAADAYEPNEFGEWNSIVLTEAPSDVKAKAPAKKAAAPAKKAAAPAKDAAPAAKAAPAKKAAAKKAAAPAPAPAPVAAPAKKKAAKKKA